MEHNKANTRILIVDDEVNIVTAIEFLLQKSGYTVEKAYEGLSAIERAMAFQPHLVVLDVMMPGIDGFEVAKRLRNIPQLADVRIIFLTAKGTENDRKTGYESGAEFYIVKPFDNNVLIDTVSEILLYG